MREKNILKRLKLNIKVSNLNFTKSKQYLIEKPILMLNLPVILLFCQVLQDDL